MAQIRDVIAGLIILSKYARDGDQSLLGGAEHDILYGPRTVHTITDIDEIALVKAGWHFVMDTEHWSRSV